jgi:hypothetical protein
MKRVMKPRGTPRQWAWANILAKRAGYSGVGAFIKEEHPEKKAAPKSFGTGVKQMSKLIADLNKKGR